MTKEIRNPKAEENGRPALGSDFVVLQRLLARICLVVLGVDA